MGILKETVALTDGTQLNKVNLLSNTIIEILLLKWSNLNGLAVHNFYTQERYQRKNTPKFAMINEKH